MTTAAEPTQAIAHYVAPEANDYAIIEKVAIMGDLAPLSPEDRVTYYTALCRSLRLNPLTKPFEYLKLDNRIVLYATRGATDQLRASQSVSVRVVSKQADHTLGVYSVEVEASTPDGRVDFASGVVAITKAGGNWKKGENGKSFFQKDGTIEPITGQDLANAIMKAETKAKRRATLSIVGLGWMDESEADVPQAKRLAIDPATGKALSTREKMINRIAELTTIAKGLSLALPLPAKPLDQLTDDEIGKYGIQIKELVDLEQAAQGQPAPL